MGDAEIKFILRWNKGTQSREIVEPCTIGRIHGELIFAQDDLMSAKHAQFSVNAKKFFICDLNSSNGSLRNKQRLPANTLVELHHGDLIETGRHTFTIEIQEQKKPLLDSSDKTHVETFDATRIAARTLTKEPSRAEISELPKAENIMEPQVIPEINLHPLPELPLPKMQTSHNEEASIEFTAAVITELKKYWRILDRKDRIIGALGLSLVLFLIFSGSKTHTHVTKLEMAEQPPQKPTVPVRISQTPPTATPMEPQPVVQAPVTPTPVVQVENTETPVRETTSYSAAALSAAVDFVSDSPVDPEPTFAVNPIPKKSVHKKVKSLYQEDKLLAKLDVFKTEYIHSQSIHARQGLELDAAELVDKHYEKFRNLLREHWQNSRELASVQKDTLKKALLIEAKRINAHNQAAKNQLNDYLSGKIKSPFLNQSER